MKTVKTRTKWALLAALLLSALSCSTVELQDSASGAHPLAGAGRRRETAPEEPKSWWRSQGDPLLDRVVRKALARGGRTEGSLPEVDAAKAYVEVAAAKSLVELARDQVGIASRLREEVRRRVAGGLCPPTEIESASMGLTWANNLLRHRRESLETSLVRLEALTGRWEDRAELWGARLLDPDLLDGPCLEEESLEVRCSEALRKAVAARRRACEESDGGCGGADAVLLRARFDELDAQSRWIEARSGRILDRLDALEAHLVSREGGGPHRSRSGDPEKTSGITVVAGPAGR